MDAPIATPPQPNAAEAAAATTTPPLSVSQKKAPKDSKPTVAELTKLYELNIISKEMFQHLSTLGTTRKKHI